MPPPNLKVAPRSLIPVTASRVHLPLIITSFTQEQLSFGLVAKSVRNDSDNHNLVYRGLHVTVV